MSKDVSPTTVWVLVLVTLAVIVVAGFRYFAEPKITSLPTLSPEEELMRRWADVGPAQQAVERDHAA